ncbi:MAG TPA: transcription antitermination factor NusB, partial [Blastocatellia bacterium]|nr:transcription antitermination factor NusB [Blastocatellia bacterium]
MKPRGAKPVVSPARRAAFDILRRVEAEGAYSSPLVASLSESDLSREDRALAQEITLGVLRWQKALDYFIERYSRRKTASLDLPVLISLRIGLYQLRHLTRVPASAAVNESVNLVKASRARSAHGFVNAV